MLYSALLSVGLCGCSGQIEAVSKGIFCERLGTEQFCHQADVYKEAGIEQMVDAVVKGYHATVFAYGQTGLETIIYTSHMLYRL